MKNLRHIITAFLILSSFGAFAQTADTTVLTASATDPNGFTITYNWTQISGPTATIVTPGNPSTVIRSVKEGTSIFQIKATNSHGAFATKTVTVLARRNQAPVIIAVSNVELILPEK